MKRFIKRPRIFSATILTLGFFVGLTCCTKVDDGLGLNLIPDDQVMVVKIDTVGGKHTTAGVRTTVLAPPDSVVASNQNMAFIGRSASANFGKTEAASLVTFFPSYSTKVPLPDTTGHGFGFRATPDSLGIIFYHDLFSGNKEAENKFNVYRMVDTLRLDSTYYQFTDPDKFLKKDAQPRELLFTFSLKGEFPNGKFVKLEPTAKGEIFMNELVADTIPYHDFEAFRKKFYGLGIVPADDSPADGAIYGLSLTNTQMGLYFHNYTSETSTEIKDEGVMLYYYFDDTRYDSDSYAEYDYFNRSVVSIKHDYTGSAAGNAYTSGAVSDRVFVQGYAGVNAQLEFSKDIMSEIAALFPADKDVVLHQVQMFVYLDADMGNDSEAIEAMNTAHSKLGSYYNYAYRHESYSRYYTIPDYSIYDEYKGQVVPYGGKLNRTYGYYSMDITTFMHYALKEYRSYTGANYDADAKLNKFTLAPTVAFQSVSKIWNGETVLQGTGSSRNPIEIKLTYTLINK